jgi:polyhydroxyalkanoate synthesis regulator phasin
VEAGCLKRHIAHERAEAVKELLRDLVEDGIISAEEAKKYT